MTCEGCGSTAAYVTRYWFSPETKKIEAVCNICSDAKASATPDVYYGYGSGVHTEENIAYPNGHPQAGKSIPFSSRREKAEAMRIAGVREAGDKHHGARHDSSMVPKNRKTYFT